MNEFPPGAVARKGFNKHSFTSPILPKEFGKHAPEPVVPAPAPAAPLSAAMKLAMAGVPIYNVVHPNCGPAMEKSALGILREKPKPAKRTAFARFLQTAKDRKSTGPEADRMRLRAAMLHETDWQHRLRTGEKHNPYSTGIEGVVRAVVIRETHALRQRQQAELMTRTMGGLAETLLAKTEVTE